MQNLISIVSGALSALVPHYIFMAIFFGGQAKAPAALLKRLYWAQALKILIISACLVGSYIISASVQWVIMSFIVTYVTINLRVFYKYG